MLRWALFFFVISIIAGALGFTDLSVTTGRIARILFVIALVIFVLFLFLAIRAGEALL